ncbi:MAG: alkaline phosphatase family protein [Acholeplasmataceae bacterium]|nr:alkaline phosphatase family protein [Acholeplasmataceae bacterium]
MMIKYPDYKNSILNVTATILKHYHAPSIYDSIPELEEELKKNYNHVVLVLLDGMGKNIIEEHLPKDAFLNRYNQKWISSIFPPTTVAATNAVLSGLPPISSGYLGWIQYFKNENSNVAVFLNHDFYHPEVKFKELLRDKYLHYPTIYEQIQKYSPEVNTYEIFPSFKENGFNSFHEQGNRLLDIHKKDIKSFSYVYWTEPDMTEHDHGIHSKETSKVLNDLNIELEKLSEELADDVLMVVIADHGLVDVESYDLLEDQKLLFLLARMPSIEPRATNFFVKPFLQSAFKRHFTKTYGKHFMLLSKKELMDSNLLGTGIKHPLLNDFLGDFIGIAIDKYMFKLGPQSKFVAHHAGLTAGEIEVPLVIFHK